MTSQKDDSKLKHCKVLAHGNIKKVFDNIWFVQGTVKMPMLMPMKISRSMTIIKNPSNNELTIINSMRLSDEGLSELEKMGQVTNVIRIAGFHGRDDGFYRERYGAKIFAIKGQVYSRKMDKMKKEDAYLQPDVWLNNDSDLPIESSSLNCFNLRTPLKQPYYWRGMEEY